MIVDHINNLGRYNVPSRKEIARYLAATNVVTLVVPETEINGRDLFVRPSSYRTKNPDEGKFETHRVYMDLQYVVQGAEIMETAPVDVLEALTEYDSSKDCQFFKAGKDISRTLVRAGEFAVFFPGEAHRPCCSPENAPSDVKKLVFKVRIGV
ncbi:MAG: YhcH/YjgK/YiaL family protein [Candidatus Omnitrophica bacterium]|nr:YhcH/YjgK/YiaL family protein [Candidatus Omnitrophota bacterium]